MNKSPGFPRQTRQGRWKWRLSGKGLLITPLCRGFFSPSPSLFRTELVKDLDCQVAFNMFDEASLADWRGRDLREAHRIPNFDILVVAVRKVHLMVPCMVYDADPTSIRAPPNSILFWTLLF